MAGLAQTLYQTIEDVPRMATIAQLAKICPRRRTSYDVPHKKKILVMN